jgi:hypothetical protein
MTELEMRYRRLLVWYPASYRQEYGEEMVGVLMDGSRPGQRHPRPGEVLDLVWTALVRRLGGTNAALGDRRWAQTVAIFGVLAPLMLLAERARELVVRFGMVRLFPDDQTLTFNVTTGFLAVSLALVAGVLMAVLAGWRRTAVIAAWVTVVVSVGVMVWQYPARPVSVVYEMVPLTLTVTMAAALSMPHPARQGVALLGWRRVAGFALAGAAWAASGLAALWGYGIYPFLAPQGMDTVIAGIVVLAAAVLVWYEFRVAGPELRRRFAALTAPAVALIPLIKLGFGGWISSSSLFTPQVHLTPGQWLVLLLTPLVAFGVGVLMVQRREETLRLVALGRDVDHRAQHRDEPGPAQS